MARHLRLALVLAALVVLVPQASWAGGPEKLVPIEQGYTGDDGSALYLRADGTTVVGLAEEPDGRYAYVLKGTRAGDTITASYWDVPKGTRKTNGALTLKVTQQGKALTTTSKAVGASAWVAGLPNRSLGPTVAAFQGTSTTNLNGAWTGDDASRHYLRKVGSKVVWVGEAAAQPDEQQPRWVTVFVGTRSVEGTLSGTFTDVPKGAGTASSTFAAGLDGGARSLWLATAGVDRTYSLEPDYVLDWDRFAGTIEDTLEGNQVTGYAYAIARNGSFLRQGAWGERITEADGGSQPFTTSTMAQAASTSKTVTAVALIKALNSRGISLDTAIGEYLPTCWEKGPSVEDYTFRQLLNHTSSLPRMPTCEKSSTGRYDTFDCLLRAVEMGQDGIVLPNAPYASRYNNVAYSLMRFLVPMVLDLDGTQAQFELFDCENPEGILNSQISEKFVHYLFEDVLDPVGVDASFYPGPSKVAYNYVLGDPSRPGYAPELDFYARSGAALLAISAPDMVRFLGALEAGEIIPLDLVAEMKADNLGLDPPAGGTTGSYYTKNGTCPDNDGRSCNAQLMLFPGGIEAYVIVNSKAGTSLSDLLENAFDGALLNLDA
jgi:CubicO group peptidase (beta-lactamase class C family)